MFVKTFINKLLVAQFEHDGVKLNIETCKLFQLISYDKARTLRGFETFAVFIS